MGIKQENEITMKVNCGINKLCRILEDKGFKVVDRFTMNDILKCTQKIRQKSDFRGAFLMAMFFISHFLH